MMMTTTSPKHRKMAIKFLERVLCYSLAIANLFTTPTSSELITSGIIKEILSQRSYDKQTRPPPQNKTTIVRIGFYMETLSSISELDMEFTISIHLRQQWTDPRLAHNSTATMVDASFTSDIWLPSIFFVNGKEEKRHDTPVPTKLLIIRESGTVFYVQKLSVRLYCGMNLAKFPFDSQTCPVEMMSYAYNSDGILLDWIEAVSPVEIHPDVELPEFVIQHTSLKNCTTVYLTGSFSCLEGRIHLKRRYLQYAIQLYVPSALIVMLSWANFWIDHRSTPARVSLALLCILTITTQSSGAGAKLPKVAYVKAIDVWMSVCLVFVFSAFIEFILVNTMARRVETTQTLGLADAANSISVAAKNIVGKQTHEDDGGQNHVPQKNKATMLQLRNGPGLRHANTEENIIPPLMLDAKSRVLFPALFVVFNIVYWIYYLTWF